MPSEDTTETVLADAARHRRRRRTATLLATGAGLAAVAAGGLALPHATAPAGDR
ncbi:hypothetical protein [Streptacidiphilus sp. P02-A3a]|uniref:hypothetical protein n=1 Tax=Streptacidiphilus sp. P02-A3a TaxID=2704468 RepID=UPI0015FAFE56|nr:hypothetical protein [Streptacidiphilus sp. P02-A3a]QMU70339.1 hypothetical protein GXP74_21110 [Streptacidiphilus sp. P02-A3a]